MDVFKRYAETLTTIAYLLSPEIVKLMEEEAHAVNMATLSNRKAYTQLSQHLITSMYET